MAEKEVRAAPFTVRIPAALKRELEDLARVDRRSLAAQIQVALEEHVTSRRGERKPASKRK
jgi:predicted transcriptional regulator